MFAAIDANARNKVFFYLPPKDARDLAHHVAPYFQPEDLMRRDAYGVVCRLVINGRDGEPFSLATRPAPPPVPGRADFLRAAARARGLSVADRRALAEARGVGPAARTTRPTGPTGGPAVNPTDPTDNPTDPTGAPSGDPDPVSGPAVGPGVSPPPVVGVRPPVSRKRKKRS
jgi:hypothetical protein